MMKSHQTACASLSCHRLCASSLLSRRSSSVLAQVKNLGYINLTWYISIYAHPCMCGLLFQNQGTTLYYMKKRKKKKKGHLLTETSLPGHEAALGVWCFGFAGGGVWTHDTIWTIKPSSVPRLVNKKIKLCVCVCVRVVVF